MLQLPLSPATIRRTFATDAASAGKQRIIITLYRQLLRWCDETQVEVPLSFYVPPVYLEPPKVDGQSLKLLASNSPDSPVPQSMLPSKSLIEENQLTVPIHSSSDARAFFRSVFRLNSRGTGDEENTEEIQKQRISLAFEGLLHTESTAVAR